MFFSKSVRTKLFILFLFFFTTQHTFAQCFEIESILVDACGSPEGENEMVRFKVGASPLNSNNLTANWPSNSFLGICQNTTTANAVTSLNSTIISCGILIEPTGGVLPANANVLLITSTAIDVAANSFANLNDTLYVIFQCAGNTGGHFANYNSSPASRTLTISFSSPFGCSDVVTYDRSLLVNQNGVVGGASSLKDGALANFTSNGTASYTNSGCQAPINPLSITAINTSSLTICSGDSINLTATTQGSFQSYNWTGNLGTFNNAHTINTTYFSSINDNSPFYIKIEGITACGAPVSDSLLVNISNSSTIAIVEADPTALCSGNPITLHTSGNATNFLWNTNATTSSININTTGEYWVTTSNGSCPSISDTINITNEIVPAALIIGDSIICTGNSATLTASGSGNFSWSTGNTGNLTTVFTAQQVILTATNNCGAIATDQIMMIETDCNIDTEITIPNVFTPNDDNFNDFFIVEGINILNFKGQIFNRWGLLIFEWNDVNSGWNGKYKNKKVPQGTYFYTIAATFTNNEEKTFKGSISLLE